MNLSQRYGPVADAIAALLHPHAEVVVHDLAADRIVHISNPYSRRRVGDRSLIDEVSELGDGEGVLGPYVKHERDGRALKSVTAVLRDDEGRPVGMLCINLDVSRIEQAIAALTSLTALPTTAARPAVLFNSDWREAINSLVAAHMASHGSVPGALPHTAYPALIAAIDREGYFAVRHAVPYVGEVLGISRATVYKHLKQCRAGGSGGGRTS